MSMDNSTSRYNVLFLCANNAGRSLMAEAMMQKMGHDKFNAYSAGNNPADVANPMAIAALNAENFDTSHLQPKHWQTFVGEDAPEMDFIFTLCDDTREDSCPNWSGDPVTAHWHFADPAQAGDEVAQKDAYSHVQRELANRIRMFLSLPISHIDRMSKHHHYDAA